MEEDLEASRVLVVDDDPEVAGALVQLLRLEKYLAVGAHSAAAALQRTAEWSPDLVLLDLSLPDGDGVEVMRRLRDLVPSRYLPIVVVTGRGGRADRAAAFAAGADDFLVKPVDVEDLVARVRAGLRICAWERRARASAALQRAAFEHSPDGLLIADASLQCVDANDAACRLLGRARASVLRQPLADLFGMVPWANGVLAAMAERRPWRGDVSLRHADGREVEVEIHTNVVQPDDSPLHIVVMRDLRPRRHAEAAARRAAQAEAAINTARAVAHEVLQPLSEVIGYSELLRQSPRSLQQVEELCGAIHGAARRAADLIHRFQRTTRYVAKSYGPGLELLDLEQSASPLVDVEGDPSTRTTPPSDRS